MFTTKIIQYKLHSYENQAHEFFNRSRCLNDIFKIYFQKNDSPFPIAGQDTFICHMPMRICYISEE